MEYEIFIGGKKTKEQAQEEYLRKHPGFKRRIEEFGVEYVKNKR